MKKTNKNQATQDQCWLTNGGKGLFLHSGNVVEVGKCKVVRVNGHGAVQVGLSVWVAAIVIERCRWEGVLGTKIPKTEPCGLGFR
jgi:hypothetical protein